MKVQIIIDQDTPWEVLYINGHLIDQDHRLGGLNAISYLLKKSEEYGFTSNDITRHTLTDRDEEQIFATGNNYPTTMSGFIDKY